MPYSFVCHRRWRVGLFGPFSSDRKIRNRLESRRITSPLWRVRSVVASKTLFSRRLRRRRRVPVQYIVFTFLYDDCADSDECQFSTLYLHFCTTTGQTQTNASSEAKGNCFETVTHKSHFISDSAQSRRTVEKGAEMLVDLCVKCQ